MIFLMGGTSETGPLAGSLADRGYRVIVSTATDAPLDVGGHPNIRRRIGRLGEEGLCALFREHAVRAAVDAAHPYAAEAHAAIRQAARRINIPCFRLDRPGVVEEGEGIVFATDHDEAARLAFSFGTPVLLTTGSRNLAPYVRESRRVGAPLAARVLPQPESLDACRAAGVPDDRIIAARGPFSVEENRAAIRRFGVGVVVTKDSGEAGGSAAKVQAAREEKCQLVVVRRPQICCANTFDSIEGLMQAISTKIPVRR
ncbi:MAG: precorrin-6A reductase [Planctomycetota bacterium]